MPHLGVRRQCRHDRGVGEGRYVSRVERTRQERAKWPPKADRKRISPLPRRQETTGPVRRKAGEHARTTSRG